MARIRTIKPDFWKNEGLSDLPEATHILAAALLNYADDEGYFNANPGLVKAECFPLRNPSISVADSLKSLHAMGYIRLGTGEDGKRYGHIVEFLKHQKVSHAAESKISKKTIAWDNSGDIPEDEVKSSERLRPELNGMELNRIEVNTEDNKLSSGADAPPSLEKQVFDEGRKLLGNNSGSLIGKLRKVLKNDDARALEIISLAREKSDPKEYIGACLRDASDIKMPVPDKYNRISERLDGKAVFAIGHSILGTGEDEFIRNLIGHFDGNCSQAAEILMLKKSKDDKWWKDILFKVRYDEKIYAPSEKYLRSDFP